MSRLRKNVKQIIKNFFILFLTSANFSRGLSQRIDFVDLFFGGMQQPKPPPPSLTPGTSGHALIYEYTTSLIAALKNKKPQILTKAFTCARKNEPSLFQ